MLYKQVDIIYLIGKYGMGKTLFVKKLIYTVMKKKENIIPIYISLRALVSKDVAELAKSKKYSAITLALIKLSKELTRLAPRIDWSSGETITGTKRSRESVVKSLCEQEYSTIPDLFKAIYDEGFLPLVVIDELEAILLRSTRRLLGDIGFIDLIVDVINSVHLYLRKHINVPGLLILASVFDEKDWIKYPLEEFARDPRSDVREFILKLGFKHEDLYPIESATELNERLRIAIDVFKSMRTRFPLLNPAVQQCLREKKIVIYYRESDYGRFIREYLGLELRHKLLTELFERIQMSMRTLIGICNNIKNYGYNHLDYDTLKEVFSEKIVELDRKIDELRDKKILLKHEKWIMYLRNMIKNGLIVLHEDIIPTLIVREGEEKEYYRRYCSTLCEVFNLSCDSEWPCKSINVSSIRNRIDNIRLKYGAIRYATMLYSKGAYYVDENLIRWLLGDPYDIFGEVVDLEDLIISYKERAKRRK